MKLHITKRMVERCPSINSEKMFAAVQQYFDTGYHGDIEKVMPARDGATILRFNQGGVVTYPIIDDETGHIITVYTQEFIKKLKSSRKFKARIRSRKCWKGKT